MIVCEGVDITFHIIDRKDSIDIYIATLDIFIKSTIYKYTKLSNLDDVKLFILNNIKPSIHIDTLSVEHTEESIEIIKDIVDELLDMHSEYKELL